MATVPTNEQDDNGTRNPHSVILDYLKTLPGVLSSAAALLVAATGLLTAFLR
ncbi:hypothetical protein [Micromonospora sp. NPDC005367]|uniref:hypothetical protein n=1 Tax=Micromonospora sp. NPDC005367 TaxID=3155590 RepID=UPI0033B68353